MCPFGSAPVERSRDLKADVLAACGHLPERGVRVAQGGTCLRKVVGFLLDVCGDDRHLLRELRKHVVLTRKARSRIVRLLGHLDALDRPLREVDDVAKSRNYSQGVHLHCFIRFVLQKVDKLFSNDPRVWFRC